jgi:transposase
MLVSGRCVMGGKRRRFTREFKLEALRMVSEGRPATEVAQELGLGRGALYRWKQQLERDGHESFPGNGRLKARDEEVERLRREVTRLRAENAFLKKVSAYFAKGQR